MDQSTSSVQDTPNTMQSDQSASSPQTNVSNDLPQQATPTQSKQTQPQQKTQVSISGGGIKEGDSVIIEDNSGGDKDDKEELQVAPQEKKNLGVMGQGDASEQDESAELAPSVPEMVIASPDVEKLVEITPPDRPKLTQEVKKIGVTHSGPGIIDSGHVNLPQPKMPLSMEEVLSEEEKIKANRLHTSKFWLLEKIKYIWRKVNPKIATTIKNQQTTLAPVSKTQQAKTGVVATDPVQATMVQQQTIPAPAVKVQQAKTGTVTATPVPVTQNTKAE